MLDLNESLDLLKSKRILITGHTGFKGSWLSYILSSIGADVLGYALPPATKPSHFELLDLESQIKHVEGDILDSEKLYQVFDEFKPEVVFHLAAQALVRPSYDDPVNTMATNVMGSVHLLEAVRMSPSVESLVYITSDKCYENVEWIWGYRENDRLGGRDPYSASKAAAELVYSTYDRSYFQHNDALGTATARAGNVIGGGDWAVDRIIPDCIRAIENDTPIHIRNPSATRPWQHVLEPLSGYLLLAANLIENKKKWEGAWNFGPPSSDVKTVKVVAESIICHIGKGSLVLGEQPNNKTHEASLLQLNCDKAHQQLNWYPRWNSNETLEKTAIWFKSIMSGENAKEITLAQINEYFGWCNDD